MNNLTTSPPQAECEGNHGHPGNWCVNQAEINVWVNASSLATEVMLEKDGTVLGDIC